MHGDFRYEHPVADPGGARRRPNAQGNLRKVIKAPLDGMDIATRLPADHVNRVRNDIDKHVAHLTDLFRERMDGLRAELNSLGRGIQLQFDERDSRIRAAGDAAMVAANAARQAQKDAAAAQNESNAAGITKSEAATVKQIDGVLALPARNTIALNDKIAGIISRVDRGEAVTSANAIPRQDRRRDGGSNVAVLGVGLLAIAVVIGLIGFVAVRTGTAPPPVIIQSPPSISATARP